MPLLSLNDFGVTYTDYTLPDTTAADVYNGYSVRVGYINQASAITVATTGADTLSGGGVTGQTTMFVTRPGEVVIFEADVGRGVWIVIPGGISDYTEFWTATPQTPMNGVINWTYQPLTNQPATPVLVSHNAGVFSPNFGAINYSIQMNTELQFNMAANNSDVSCDIIAGFTGTGLDYLPNLKDAFFHARTATFPKTYQSNGAVFPVVGDTFQFTSSNTGTGGSTTDLVYSVLVIGV
jgi:hypothetical protein